MFLRKRSTTADVPVSSLKKSVSRSLFRRVFIRLATLRAKFRRFYVEFRVPVVASTVFLGVLVVLAGIRQLEKTSLLSLRSEVAGSGGYSLLLREDEADEFTRNDTSEDTTAGDTNDGDRPVATNTTQSTSNPFVINDGVSSPTNTGGGSTSGGGTSSGSGGSTGGTGGSSGGSTGGGGGGGVTQPPEPFAASIDSFQLVSVTLQCSNPSKPNKGSCAKVYAFSSAVRSSNGPGSVVYAWSTDASGGSSTGNFSVGGSEAITSLSKEISFACNRVTTFSMQFRLTAPTTVSSSIINSAHNCNEL